MAAARRITITQSEYDTLYSGSVSSGMIIGERLLPTDEFFEKKAITKQYDHSKGINLRRLPIYYVHHKTGEQVFKHKTRKVFRKDIGVWEIYFTSEDINCEVFLTLEEFNRQFKYYDPSSPDYFKKAQDLHAERNNKMTASEFFSQNNRSYPLHLFTYDFVSSPGFSSSKVIGIKHD